jgi:hypothetical protein
MPAHLLKHHVDKVQLRPKTTDHNIFAYVIHDTEELEICACLTCDRGALGDGNTGNSARWVEMHSKNTSCKKTHPAALEKLKGILARKTVPETTVHTVSNLHSFIEYFKANNEIPCTIVSSRLYGIYAEWCEQMDEQLLTLRSFGLEMIHIVGISKTHSMIGNTYTITMPLESAITPVSPTAVSIEKEVLPVAEKEYPAVLSVPPTAICTGYVYCFVNESMPGLAKIGMTTRTPQERLEEANASDTWKPPTPYTIAFAKSVTDPKAKERTVHKLLEKYVDKIHKRREFFRISVDDARLFFDLMDGAYWASTG